MISLNWRKEFIFLLKAGKTIKFNTFPPIFILAFGWCFFGTFQTAEPLKQGEMDVGPYAKWTALHIPRSRKWILFLCEGNRFMKGISLCGLGV